MDHITEIDSMANKPSDLGNPSNYNKSLRYSVRCLLVFYLSKLLGITLKKKKRPCHFSLQDFRRLKVSALFKIQKSNLLIYSFLCKKKLVPARRRIKQVKENDVISLQLLTQD